MESASFTNWSIVGHVALAFYISLMISSDFALWNKISIDSKWFYCRLICGLWCEQFICCSGFDLHTAHILLVRPEDVMKSDRKVMRVMPNDRFTSRSLIAEAEGFAFCSSGQGHDLARTGPTQTVFGTGMCCFWLLQITWKRLQDVRRKKERKQASKQERKKERDSKEKWKELSNSRSKLVACARMLFGSKCFRQLTDLNAADEGIVLWDHAFCLEYHFVGPHTKASISSTENSWGTTRRVIGFTSFEQTNALPNGSRAFRRSK